MLLSGMCNKLICCILLIFLSGFCSPPSQMVRKNSDQAKYNKKRVSSNEAVESFSWDNSTEELPFEFEKKEQISSKISDNNPNYLTRPVSYHKKIHQKVIINSKRKKPLKTSNRRQLFIWYKIKKGDTLYSIARKHKIPLRRLCSINNIKNPAQIKAGMRIKLKDALSPESNKFIQKKKTKRNNRRVKKYVGRKDAPDFRWPIQNIQKVKKDGGDGVKSLGIIIISQGNNSVASAASGVVRKVGYMRGYGNFIMISHKNRYMTIYSNLEMVNVSQGDRVARGSFIGKLDMRNKNLHFQISEAGKPKNPLNFLPGKKG